MNKLIYTVLGLLLLTLNVKAIPGNSVNGQRIVTTEKLAAQPAVALVTGDDNLPVYQDGGFIHHLVFLDEENNHTPISFHDYNTWTGIFGFILLLVITLLIIVKAETFIAALNVKYGSDKKKPLY
jgi:hypothetical protein